MILNDGQKKIAKNTSALIDKPIHIFEDGKIRNQGTIIEDNGFNVLVQLYSFMDGSPTDIILIPKAILFTEKYTIYESDYKWHKAFFEEMERDGLLSGSVEYNLSLVME